MIASGGIEPNIDSQLYVADPWPQGLGILDMTDLQWKDSYDSTAQPYQTPQRIKDAISHNGRYPASWESALIKQWFLGDKKANSATSSTTPSSSTSATSPSAAASSTSSSTSSKINHGAVIGGVVGGVGGAILIAAVAWFVLRRRKKSRSQTSTHNAPPTYEKAELDGRHTSTSYWNRAEPRELDAGKSLHEMPGSGGEQEMPGSGGAHEMPVKRQ